MDEPRLIPQGITSMQTFNESGADVKNACFLQNILSPENFHITPIDSILADIKNERHKAAIAALPDSVANEKAYKAAKGKLPAWAFNGTFSGKVDNAGFVESNCLFHVDIDGLVDTLESVKEKLTDCQYVYAVWQSPSGRGLKVLIKINPDLIKNDADFKKAFIQIAQYFSDHDITIDKSCKDIRRLCFVCSDPNIYINKEAPAYPFDMAIWEQTNKPKTKVLPTHTPAYTPEIPAHQNNKDFALNNVRNILLRASKGNYHESRLKAGRLAGGYVAGGVLDQTVLNELDAINRSIHAQYGDSEEVQKTEAMAILDGFSYGMRDPITSSSTKTIETYLAKPFLDNLYKTVGCDSQGHTDNEGDTVTNVQHKPDDYKIKLAAHVELFNKDHAQVLIGGKHRIMRTVPASVNHDNRESYEFLSQDSLARIYQNTLIQTGWNKNGDAIYKDHLTAWAKGSKSRTYRGGVIFKPNGKLSNKYFNTWQGFIVIPKSNSDLWAGIKHHIEEVVCCGDQELIEYFYNWVAYTFQHPDKPAGAALVLRGGKGSGKGTIGHFLAKLWGIHALHISNAKHLTGNFNGHLNDVCFLFADEAFFSADKQHEGVLKALITEPTVTIERKGIDAASQPNYLKVFMATNNDWAVPASKDERRYCVFDVSSERIGDKAYFDSLHHDCNDKDVQAAFLFDMLKRDISNFHTGQIPDTDGLKDQRMQSLTSMGKWLVDSLNGGYFEQDGGAVTEWQKLITAKELFSSYLFWCDNQRTGEYNRVTQTALGKYFTDMGFKKVVSNGIHRQMGTLEDAIRKFETYEKVKITTVPK